MEGTSHGEGEGEQPRPGSRGWASGVTPPMSWGCTLQWGLAGPLVLPGPEGTLPLHLIFLLFLSLFNFCIFFLF